jgi:hypothetical protein
LSSRLQDDTLTPEERAFLDRAASEAEQAVDRAGYDLEAGLAAVHRRAMDAKTPRSRSVEASLARYWRNSTLRAFMPAHPGFAITLAVSLAVAGVVVLSGQLRPAKTSHDAQIQPIRTAPQTSVSPRGSIPGGEFGGSSGAGATSSVPRGSAPRPPNSPGSVPARAKITDPATDLTTSKTSLQLSIAAAPATVAGWVWYVVVQPAHHTTSDYLYRFRPELGSITIGVGPATGGSGATDDYVIRPALIRSSAAADIGGYRDDLFAPADTRYFSGITVHRESQ